jgi:hypothetical protein
VGKNDKSNMACMSSVEQDGGRVVRVPIDCQTCSLSVDHGK